MLHICIWVHQAPKSPLISKYIFDNQDHQSKFNLKYKHCQLKYLAKIDTKKKKKKRSASLSGTKPSSGPGSSSHTHTHTTIQKNQVQFKFYPNVQTPNPIPLKIQSITHQTVTINCKSTFNCGNRQFLVCSKNGLSSVDHHRRWRRQPS